jgi:hypothetical protein
MIHDIANKTKMLGIFFVTVTLITLNTLPVYGQETTAFTNVNVIPMNEERVLENQTVLIIDGRIDKIGPQEKIDIPEASNIIDGKGQYLTPGLADMHMHLTHDSDPRHLRLYLANGVTTVRNLGGTHEHLNWKKQIEQGKLIGPTILTTGPIVLGAPPGFEWFSSFYFSVITLFPLFLGLIILIIFSIFLKLTRRPFKIRYHFRKLSVTALFLMILGGLMAWSRVIPFPEFGALVTKADAIGVAIPADAEYVVKKQYAAGFRAIKPYDWIDTETFLSGIGTAKSLGMYSVGHAPDQIPLKIILESGLNEFAHMDEFLSYAFIGYDYSAAKAVTGMELYKIDDRKIPEIVALVKKNKVSVTATLVTDENICLFLEDAEKFYSNPAFQVIRPEKLKRWKTKGRIVNWKGQEDWRRNQWKPFLSRLTKALHEADVPILLGTDAKVDGIIPGYHVHKELELLVESGLSPYEALATGTINAALIAGKMSEDGNWGAIAPGNRADLVLLRNNPLKNISNTRDRVGVMVRGKWYTQADLNKLVNEYTATFAK